MSKKTPIKACFACLIAIVLLIANFGIYFFASEKIHDSHPLADGFNHRKINRRLLEDTTPECEDVHNANTSEAKCLFVKSHCTGTEGYFIYYDFIYCTVGSLTWLAMTVLIIWWLFLFIGLAVTADDFFCPALVVISKTLGLSPNVAGVTFLAFGNGAPDFFSAISALSKKDADIALGISGLFGAGMFVTACVVGSIALVKPFTAMARPFLRDIIFYIVAVFWVFKMLWVGSLSLYEVCGLVGLYVVYVIVVVVSGAVYKQMQEQEDPIAREDMGLTVYRRRITLIADRKISMKYVNDNLAYTDDFQNSGSYIKKTDDVQESNNKQDENNNYMNGAAVMEDEGPRRLTKSGSASESRPIRVSLQIPTENGLSTFTLPGEDIDDELGSEEKEEFIPLHHQFLYGICPIDLEEWPNMSIFGKVYEIFKCPIIFVIKITCPVVDYEISDTDNWNRGLNTLHCFISPTFAILIIQAYSYSAGPVPIYGITLIIGAIFAALVWFTSDTFSKPKYHSAFGYFGFVVAILWIRSLATEIVELLSAFGVVFKIDTAILGLTLLAWGNSIGDLIANVIMARQGFARMGFSACFGAPIFNLTMGFGLSMIISCITQGIRTIELEYESIQLVLAVFVMISCCSSLVAIPFILRWNLGRIYGVYLLLLYVAFIGVAVMTSLGKINFDFIEYIS